MKNPYEEFAEKGQKKAKEVSELGAERKEMLEYAFSEVVTEQIDVELSRLVFGYLAMSKEEAMAAEQVFLGLTGWSFETLLKMACERAGI